MKKYLWSFARGDRLGVCDFSSLVLLQFCSGFFVCLPLLLRVFGFLFFAYLCFAFTAVFTVLLALS